MSKLRRKISGILIVFLFLIIMSILVFIDNYYNIHILTSWKNAKHNAWGFTINNEIFVWIAGIIGFAGYSIHQRQKLVAEQIAKSRIEWLSVTRKYISNYMASAEEYWHVQNKLRIGQAERKKKKNKNDVELEKLLIDLTNKENDLIIESEKQKNLSMYSLNPNESITVFLREYAWLTDFMYEIDKVNYGKLVRIVSSKVQEYFKREWDKSKDEIETGVVYRSGRHEHVSDKIFIHVMDIIDDPSLRTDSKNGKEKSYLEIDQLEIEYSKDSRKNKKKKLKELKENCNYKNYSEVHKFAKKYDKDSKEYELLKTVGYILANKRLSDKKLKYVI